MANFIFNPVRVNMATTVGMRWMSDDIIGVLYDNRIDPTPDMDWGTLASYEVSQSGTMSGRSVSTGGACRGSTLEFQHVITAPGLKIKGLLLASYVSGDVAEVIANFTQGLDGFSGNNDLNMEANDLTIYARTSASNSGTWIQL